MNSVTASKFKNIVLYSYWRSSCSWRVRLALNLKKVPYELQTIHLIKGDNKTEEFSKINPIQKIPVLVFTQDDSEEKICLAESLAICEFLEDAFTDVKLLPEDIIKKAKVRAFCSEISCNIQPIQNLPVINRIQEIGGDKMEWGKEWIGKGLEIVEKILSTTRGKYCFGDNLTLADTFLIPQLYNARRFSVDLSSHTNILEVEKNLTILDEFVAAHPDNQPDFEPNK